MTSVREQTELNFYHANWSLHCYLRQTVVSKKENFLMGLISGLQSPNNTKEAKEGAHSVNTIVLDNMLNLRAACPPDKH